MEPVRDPLLALAGTRMRMLERRERDALPVCGGAAHGAFTMRHSRFHVQAVLDEIVGRAVCTDTLSGAARLMSRLLLRLLLRLSSADSPKLPDDHQ